MRKHTFSLETVLDYRHRLEEAGRKELADALAALRAEEHRMEEMRQEYSASVIELDGLKEKGAAADELDMHFAYLDALKKRMAGQEITVAKASDAAEGRRGELLEASRNRKMIDIMKEKSLAAHNLKADKEEQKDSDELSTLRFGRKDGDEG